MILVMACRIVTPAFSISFFDKPDVMQTLSAGLMLISLVPMLPIIKRLLDRVMSTPFASAYAFLLVDILFTRPPDPQ